MNIGNMIFTNEKCIGCGKCVSACPVRGAHLTIQGDGKRVIEVDPSRCIGCGKCVSACKYNAREYMDDTERFFADLKAGKQISILISPSFKGNYPDRYDEILGALKSLGANHFINVAFGADIMIWAYINYIKNNDFKGGISPLCPCVVKYVETFIPTLIPKLIPVQSPLICAAIYAKKYMNITDELAFISPCVSAKWEIEDPDTKGVVAYNMTFSHLMKYIEENNLLKGEIYTDEVEYGLGSAYPLAGGVGENVRWLLGENAFVRQVDGEERVYEYLEKNREFISESLTPYIMTEASNCRDGCLYGPGCEVEKKNGDALMFDLIRIKESSKRLHGNSAWSRDKSPKERLESLNAQFAELDIEDFLHSFTDHSRDISEYALREERIGTIMNAVKKNVPNDATLGKDSVDGAEIEAKILVIDDTLVNLQMIRGLLKDTGVKMYMATSGSAALKQTAKVAFDLILMDYMMPEMDGEEAMKLIRSQEGGMNTETPIIVQTANTIRNANARYEEMGFAGYLPKPIPKDALMETIRKWAHKEDDKDNKEELCKQSSIKNNPEVER